MSTKAIRKVLRDMQCDYAPCLPRTCRKHEALAEVEAIERAAKTLDTKGVTKEALRAALLHLQSIAKDMP